MKIAPTFLAIVLAVLAMPPLLTLPAVAEEDYAAWPLLRPSFPSTGGNGVMIGEYRPVVIGDRCATAFTATIADGTVYRNIVVFEAVPAQGGILCANGKWSAADGSAAGTTPYRVFIRDGVARGAP